MDDDDELGGDSLGVDDDDIPGEPAHVARARRAAIKAQQLARRALREQRDRGIHLFGRAQLLDPNPNPAAPGWTGRADQEMSAMKTKLAEHDRRFETLDRIQWKILAAASVSGISAALLWKLVERVLLK